MPTIVWIFIGLFLLLIGLLGLLVIGITNSFKTPNNPNYISTDHNGTSKYRRE